MSNRDGKSKQLLPLEEKEPVPCPGCGRHEPYCDCPPGMYDKKEPEPVDHGTQKSKDSIDVEFIHADCTHETKSCLVMSAVSQMCEKCAERHRLVTSLRSEPDGTQKGPASAGQIIPGEGYVREAEIRKRIRTRLLHGHWPEMSDLLAWWEATTGEMIEWGRRCERCGCSGKSPVLTNLDCEACQGSGYSVRPTWMNQ